jgi:hypothetical protein
MSTKTSLRSLLATAVMATTIGLSGAPVLARGGAANLMDSP